MTAIEVEPAALEPISAVYDDAAECFCDHDPGLGRHDDDCARAPMAAENWTKAQFVAGSQANAHAAIWAYLHGRVMGLDHDEALEHVVFEAAEAAAGFAGIGGVQ